MSPGENDRHASVASSGAQSWKSDDTVRPAGRSTFSDGEYEISPMSNPSYTYSSAKADIAPWDDDEPPGAPDNGSPIPSSGGVPALNFMGSGAENGSDPSSPVDGRRPSIASATTVSSQGSNQSRGASKKLQTFFGEDMSTIESRQTSQTSPPPSSSNSTTKSSRFHRPAFARSNSSSLDPKNSNQGSSRPRTPQTQPYSDVTPWMYQDPEETNHHGNAPVHKDLQNADNGGAADRKTAAASASKSAHSHKLHLHRHKPSKSGDTSNTRNRTDSDSTTYSQSSFPEPPWAADEMPTRLSSKPSKDQHSHNAPPDPKLSHTESKTWPAKPSKAEANGSGKKTSLFDKIRHRIKDDKPHHEPLKEMPGSSSSLQQQQSKPLKNEQPPAPLKQEPSHIETGTGVPLSQQSTQSRSQAQSKTGIGGRLPFNKKKTQDTPNRKDPNEVTPGTGGNESLWTLDTNLDDMSGIVDNQQPVLTPGAEQSADSWLNESTSKKDPSTAIWDAPDSWAIKKAGEENVSRLQEIDDSGEALKDEDPGVPFSLRIFKQDGSYATLSIPLNTTAAEVVQILGKKTILQDELDTYQLIMHKHDLARQLEPGERPVVIQKRLLEQVGYNESDHIEELGREDHTYLCKFIFLPAKAIGYSSLSKDPGFNKQQKFSNMDLQGRNLITIPIALYQKSSEIVFLNLSRNPSLDVPKDFIRGCANLREIRYTGNEAWRVPPSFCLAMKLTVLDLSNNRLEQLEHAGLNRLENLASLKLSNNLLTDLPEHFAEFKSLRSLNLSSNSLSEFPASLARMKTLVDLDISFNSISSISGCIELVNLERLWATNNKLSGKPGSDVSNLKNLREVDLRFNTIENLDSLAELPQLEHLWAGHNNLASFEGTFEKIKTLYLDHNPITRFNLGNAIPSLATLSLASAKLNFLPDDLFPKMTGLVKLILDKNHFSSFTWAIGKLQKLDHLSIAKNSLSTLPVEIGRLLDLRFLDVRENNISWLPSEIWYCRKLETLNVSSNVLDSFPKAPSQSALAGMDQSGSNGSVPGTPSLSAIDGSEEDSDKVGEMNSRRMSQASGYMSSNTSPGSSYRKGSFASTYGPTSRKPSMMARTPTDSSMSPLSRKDSIMMTRTSSTFAGSLKRLLIADNRLADDIFDQLALLQELRVISLSYNELYDIPPRTVRKWQYLQELYLSGNELSSLPAEDFEEISGLKVLLINANKFQVLPAELGKLTKLTILDVASNLLKYNVSNWPYDWNWNCNPALRSLNLSGNKRLEIKPAASYHQGRDARNLTDFTALTQLRILGLMDVTLMIPSVPDQNEDRRVRTSGSTVGTMGYGIADSLGNNEHLSTIDIVVPRLEHEDEVLVGLFDGEPLGNSGSKIAAYLHEHFKDQFREEMRKKTTSETAADALRRTYLALNKQLGIVSTDQDSKKMQNGTRWSASHQALTQEDIQSGAVATVLYLHGMELYVSNVGNIEAILIQSEGGYKPITEKHDPASMAERQRIREAGGFVSKQGKLNDILDVSRGFGFTQHIPSVIAAPYVNHLTIQDSDEIILLASREMWDYLSPDFAVDLARSERSDLMRAAQKLRDIAIAFGASNKLTVMVIGVSDLRKRERARYRTHSMSMGPSGQPDDWTIRRPKRGRDATLDSKLARLDQEVEAPVGDVSLVFTDIKNSTLLWETYPQAMRSAIKMHNEVMRRQLRLVGGYEVKTEGDAFMVAFPTVTSALLWCFTIQSQLLEVQWPQEILNSVNGQEVCDAEGNVLFRGLSVRMGIHWGQPVHETDPVTRRMDYFGPMVNRSARISAVADGGQITVSADFIAEVQRLLETYIESDRSNSTSSEDQFGDDPHSANIGRELRSLTSHGFEVKDLGERRLKGLENPEYIYLMYPHSLAGRLVVQQQRADAEKAMAEGAGAKSKDSQLTIDLDSVWTLWNVSLRLEMLCSTLESPDSKELKAPETALLERTRERGGEVTDRFLVNFVEHQISRIETCITTLAIRNLLRPFKDGMLQQACPMGDLFNELAEAMTQVKAWKEDADMDIAPS